MKIFSTLVLALIGITVAAAVYIRLAPVSPADWHVAADMKAVGDQTGERSHIAVRHITTTPDGILQALQAAALATPRTALLADDEGLLTFVTRSRVFGFPDFTTAAIIDTPEGPLLQLHGRAKYGKLDLGVNKARVTDWLAQLGPLVVAPS